MKRLSSFGAALLLALGCGRVGVPAPLAASAGPPVAPAVKSEEADEEGAVVPLRSSDATWGSRTAPVTIVEFADFECPFCERAEAALTNIRERYGPARVRIVWKNDPLPFHPNARPAAEAAVGVHVLAGSEAFWRFHDLALRAQSGLSEEMFVSWARAVGLRDIDGFRAGLRGHVWWPRVDADVAEARKLGATGTPWFFINGVRLVGAQPESGFQAIIDAQLLAAENKIAAGVAPDRVYAALAKDNFAPAAEEVDDDKSDAKTIYKVPLGSSPARGNAAALVTMVEFTDYQCPYCGRAEATIQKLRARYGGALRLVVKNEPLPFHEHAEPAAEAALEVRAEKGDAGFWAMHDALFQHQESLDGDTVVRLAEGAGAHPDLVRAAMAKRKFAAAIEADLDLADDLGADGTPHFFIDGRRLTGAQPEEKFAAIIDDELMKAQALVSSGTKPEAVYETLTKDGEEPPAPERKDVAPLPSGDPSRGALAARVIVHEFADYQCPFCVRAEATVREIAKNYAGKVRLVWHDLPLPFHPNAPLAARAAREARAQRGERAFWDLHDRMLVDGAKLSRADLDDDARSLGLDMGKWNAAFDNGAHDAAIDADRAAANALGLDGTPSFLIATAGGTSGYVIAGAQSYSKFRKVVERALAEGK